MTVAASVARYMDDIREWEVYNAFNGSFANSPNKPRDYAELVKATWDAAKTESAEELIRLADEYLYRAKRSGRNRSESAAMG